MSGLIKFLGFLIWAAVIPFLAGLLPVSLLPLHRRRFHYIVICGYLLTFSVFEVIGLPVLFWTWAGNFRLLLILYVTAMAAIVVIGLIRTIRTGGIRLGHHFNDEYQETFQRDPTAAFLTVVFFVLLIFILYMAYTRASFDGDDAYYVAQSVQTWQTGTMYNYVPYTGVSTTLDGRHAMAMLPMWIAAIATLCGTHPTIVTHSMLPLLFIPLYETAAYGVASRLVHKEPPAKRQHQVMSFMVLLEIFQIFGNVSIYTPETFLIMRSWQGKTMFAVFILPCAFLALLMSFEQAEEQRFATVSLLLLNTSCGITTSLAPAYTAAFLLLGTVVILIVIRVQRHSREDGRIFLRTLLCCIPNVIYTLILLHLMYPAGLHF